MAYIIKRDADQHGKPLQVGPDGEAYYGYWAGKNGGEWGFSCGVTKYATRKLAEAALKRNTKRNRTFVYAYIVEAGA